MLRCKAIAALLGPALLLAACAQTPMGPTVAVMPAPVSHSMCFSQTS